METAQTRSGRRSRSRRAGRLPMQDRPGANANARVPFRGVAHEPACPFSRLWPGTHRPLHAVAGAHRASPAALVVRDVPLVLCRRARGGRSSSCESSARLHHSRTGCCRCPVEPVQPCPAAAWPLVFSAVQFQQGVVWGAQVPFLAFLLPRALAGGHRHAPRDRARVRRAAPTTIATVFVGLRLAAGPYRRAAPLGTSIITCHSCASIGNPPSSRSLGHSRSYCCSTDGFSTLCTRAQIEVRHGVCCALKHLQPAYWCAG